MPSVAIETSTQTPRRKPKKQPAREKDPLARAAARYEKRGLISDKAAKRMREKARA